MDQNQDSDKLVNLKSLNTDSEKVTNLKSINADSEKLANLKSLNSLLVKETVERREQVDSLLKSKKELEIEIDLLKKQSDETQIQKSVMIEFMNKEVEQEKEKLKEKVWREKDVLKGLLDEKIREIGEVSSDFQRYRDDVEKDLDLKRSEVEMFKSVVFDLEKGNEDVNKEIKKIRFEKNEVLEKKNELEKRIEELSREMVEVVKGRGEIEKVKFEQDVEIRELKKSVDVLNAELVQARGVLDRGVIEKDEILKRLSVQTKEMERVKVQILELEKCNSATEMELGKLRNERRGLMDERKERERKFEGVLKEKTMIEQNMVEMSKLVEELKGDIKRIDGEKEVIEQEKTKDEIMIAELEKEVERLQVVMQNAQKEEANLHSVVANLEKKNVEALEKQEQTQLEVEALVREKTEIQKSFELLMEEKNSISKNLETALNQLKSEKSKMADIINEKAAIEKAKSVREVEIDNLQKQVCDLQSDVSTLEESHREQAEANAKLQAEAKQYQYELISVTAERDDVRNESISKAKEEERLRSEVLELGKRIGEAHQNLEQVMIEHRHLSEEKKEMKAHIGTLTEEKKELQHMLEKAEEGTEAFETKMKLSETCTGQALQMLKHTVELVCRHEDAEMDGKEEMTIINGDKIAEQIQPFAAELEAIRKAFKNKKGNVDDMNKQFESLRLSIVQAQKKKKMWAWLSYVSTFFTAAAVAYAARVR
ncbi:myosin-9 [Thalictrum thalictroides]|uniref:Myosin-9 n=1 Tax=Thalictrum thalictroides TaxID=46969 RepID=A0A7J6WQX0_THATH|nr:myosin-9 [Thalictrum thalictroides]